MQKTNKYEGKSTRSINNQCSNKKNNDKNHTQSPKRKEMEYLIASASTSFIEAVCSFAGMHGKAALYQEIAILLSIKQSTTTKQN
jgi:hypothetical protein